MWSAIYIHLCPPSWASFPPLWVITEHWAINVSIWNLEKWHWRATDTENGLVGTGLGRRGWDKLRVVMTYIHGCCFCCLVARSCPALLRPHELPGSSLYGISQAGVLEWVAISFSGGSSQSRSLTLILSPDPSSFIEILLTDAIWLTFSVKLLLDHNLSFFLRCWIRFVNFFV